jgi:ATP-dependent Clp protease ATP-binding subunit ClpC
MVKHNDSLVLAWHIAELEAKHLGSKQIDPAHLFLGLLKIVDLDLERVLARTGIDSTEVESQVDLLRLCFGEYDLDTTQIRRRLRRYLKKGEPIEGKIRLRRSQGARETFAKAEKLAEVAGGNVHPIHLTVALLKQQDPSVESVLESTGCFPTELRRYLEAQLSKLKSS